MEIEYLTKEQLAGFDKYKYSCIDTGLLSTYVMHPFWNWVVQFCPRSIAPNLLTFVGFLFTVATLLVFTILDYDYFAMDQDHPEVPVLPNWTFLAASFFLFMAYTLDGIDGKQARRTGTSNPLGELFDHGLDSYAAGLIPTAMYSIFGRNELYSLRPYRMFFILWNIIGNFFVSHFEKYNTGILFLPWGYDFSMWGTIGIFAVTGIFGPQFWQFRFANGFKTGHIFEIVVYSVAVLSNLPIVFLNIHKSYQDKTGYMRPFNEAIRPLIPVTVLFTMTLFWVRMSPSDILEQDPRAIFLIVSTIFSNICCRLIVAQMSSTRCEAFNWFFIPTSLVIIISLLIKSAIIELVLTYVLLVFVTIAHIHYGTCIVRQMCRHFNINCFSIKKVPEKE